MKRFKTLFFLSYFSIQLVWITIHVYLPVYFFNVLNIDRVELAFTQIFSYIPLLIKPLFSYFYLDKTSTKKRGILIISSLLFFASFIVISLSLVLLIIFAIFLGVNIAFISILDATVDKILLEQSKTEEIKRAYSQWTQIGSILGAVFPNILFFIIATDVIYASFWMLFLFICIIAVSPVLIIGFLIPDIEISPMDENSEIINKKIDKRYVVLMCIFAFLISAEQLFQYPFEPWLLKNYLRNNYMIFALMMLLIILINLIGVIIGKWIPSKYNKKKLLILFSILSGLMLMFGPFFNFILFALFMVAYNIFGGIVLILWLSLMIDISKGKGVVFQIIAIFSRLASILLIPLGTILSASIKTEFILLISGVLMIFSIIPLIFIKIEND